MFDCRDTIVAVSTPLGSGARAILRLSGERALEVALRRFTPNKSIPPGATYRAFAGAARVEAGPVAADVPATLLVMRAPRSYTREDVVELHVPGSPPLVEGLMAALCEAGARPAAPGEFTARAFAAGRIDLAQAEAVMAVIAASGRRSLAAAQRMLEGRLSTEVNSLVDRLRTLLARVELSIDFSEDNQPLTTAGEVAAEAIALRDEVVALSRRSRDVAHLDGDLRVALVGRPNVGKSSLFNRLAGGDRAMVTDVAGTTRDELRESFLLAGSRFVLSDTAGLDDALADLGPRAGDAGTGIARAARERTLAALARAELVLVVVEASRMRDDAGAREDVRRLLATLAAPAILVVNKVDLVPPVGAPGEGVTATDGEGVMVTNPSPFEGEGGRRPGEGEGRPGTFLSAGTLTPAPLPRRERGYEAASWMGCGVPVVATSAVTGQGLEELRAAMVETLRLGEVDRTSDGPAVASRHRRCLELAAEGLARAADLCGAGAGDGPGTAGGFSEELVAVELREALEALGGITGRTSPEEVLAEIFSRFCIGK